MCGLVDNLSRISGFTRKSERAFEGDRRQWHLKRFIICQRGYGTFEFLLYAGLIIFLVFGSIDYALTQNRISQVDMYKEYYLDRVRLEGWLSTADESALVSGLSAKGYQDITIDAPRESQGHSRILRNTEDPAASEVWLGIQCRPVPQPLKFGGAIGSPAGEEFVINVGGRALSERVDP